MAEHQSNNAILLIYEIKLEAMRANDRTTESKYLEQAYLDLAADFEDALRQLDTGRKCPKCEAHMDNKTFDWVCTRPTCGEKISIWRPG